MSFTQKTAQERKNELYRLFKKYPDKIPVIIKKDKSCNLATADVSTKFLIPKELTVGQLLYTLRKRIMINPDQALFIFFNNQLVNTACTMQEIYTKHHNKEDEMLYAIYTTESTFG